MHYTLVVSYKPLISALPLSLAHMSHGMPKSNEPAPSMFAEEANPPAPVGTVRPSTPPVISEKATASPISQSGARLVQHPNRPSEDQPIVPRRPSQPDPIVQKAIAFPHRPNSGLEEEAEPRGLAFGDALVDVHTGDFPGMEEIAARLDLSLKGIDPTPAVGTAPGPPRSRVSSRRPSRQQSSGSSPANTPVNDEVEMQDMQRDPEKGLRSGEVDEKNRRVSTGGEEDNPFFAVPGGPGVRPRHVNRGDEADTFLHPAATQPQRVVWLPRDELGLTAAEVQKNEECGVKSSSRHATFVAVSRAGPFVRLVTDVQGKVRISGRPPDDYEASQRTGETWNLVGV